MAISRTTCYIDDDNRLIINNSLSGQKVKLMIVGALTCRAARGLLDWTQARLAAAANVALSTVKNFEAGRSLPSEANLFAIQRALEDAQVEFLPEGAVRLRPDLITFRPDYRVDRYKFRMIAYRVDRVIIVDIARETVDDAATLSGASSAERDAGFQRHRREIEDCARDVVRNQAPGVERVSIDTMTFHEWRLRRRKLIA
jgi:transcriptional regulator with XRE-family HTH domain